MVSFGLAGDAVNLLDDWAHRVPPLSGSDLHDFIRAPRASRKLFGYQGLPAVDARALEDLAARLTRLKDNHPEIALVDFNPVLAGPEGASILAADVRIANAAQRTDSARRAMRSWTPGEAGERRRRSGGRRPAGRVSMSPADL